MTDPFGVLLVVAIGTLFGGALVSIARQRLGYILAAVGSVLLAVSGMAALVHGSVVGARWTGPLGNPEGFALDALSGFFVLAAAIVWITTSVYSLYYDERPGGLLAVAYCATLGSIAVLVASTDFVLFLVGWEGMTIAAFAMILEATGRPCRTFSAAFVFLAFGEASTLLVIVAVAGLRVASGSFVESPVAVGTMLTNVVFVAALLGFGLKMGVAPFHMSEWLPIAHSSAPANASAVLSSTVTLAGVYGLFRVLSLLPFPPAWWGALMLAIGAVSALLGALFAAVSEHSKGLPAYSTVENNGLILVALGVALVARSDGLPTLYAFALFTAFFQALVHAVAKSALFLSAGYVERTAHTSDLNSVEGRAKGTEGAAHLGAFAASLSLAATPPLAGFVGEWMILEALFQSYRFSPPLLQFIGLLSGAAVALAAGLILVAMVKFVGFAMLWRPRPASPAERPRGLGPVLAAIGAVVLGLGVGAPWVLKGLAPAVSTFAGRSIGAPVGGLLDVPLGWSILSGAPFGILSPPMIAPTIAVGACVALGYYVLARPRTFRRVEPWMAGSAPGRPGESYTSFGYSTGLRIMLRSLLGMVEIRTSREDRMNAGVGTPEAYDVDLEVLDPFKAFYDGLGRFGTRLSEELKQWIMPGRLGRYLLYILVVTLAVIVYTAYLG